MGRKSKRNITNKKRKHHKKNTKHRRRRVNITRKKGGVFRGISARLGLSEKLYPKWHAQQEAMQQQQQQQPQPPPLRPRPRQSPFCRCAR